MSDELYICIECEVASHIDDPTPLNEHGLCPRCGSSSVVSIDTLSLLALKKAKDNASVEATEETKHRIQAMKDQRKRDSRPLVDYLKSLIRPNPTSDISIKNAAIIAHALEEWDGWAWHVDYPWEANELGKPLFIITLIQGVKNGPRWVIGLNAEIVEVSLFQDGMN